jgi:7,8-dihydro-6-hydroxymethylpterin-pyrophosphokinase
VALHPEMGESNIGDKCHQLRTAIQYLNKHAKKLSSPVDTFHLMRVELQTNLDIILFANTIQVNRTSITSISLFWRMLPQGITSSITLMSIRGRTG